MGQLKNVAILRTGPEMGNRVREILELPHDGWIDVKVGFDLDEAATATVTMMLSGEQLVALAQVAADQAIEVQYGNDCSAEEPSVMHSDPGMGPAG